MLENECITNLYLFGTIFNNNKKKMKTKNANLFYHRLIKYWKHLRIRR